jgi:hypothetical protein
MKKKLVTLLAAALLTVSFAGNALAAFQIGDLIRVTYDTVGTKEYATDLGNWASMVAAAKTGNVTVGGGTDAITLANLGTASWSNLVVGYYLIDNTASANQMAIAGNPGGLTSAGRSFASVQGNATSTLILYSNNAAGATSVTIADKSVLGSFYGKMDGGGINIGAYGGWINNPAVNNPGGMMNLAALATTGYVDQAIYSWTGANLSGSGALPNTTVAFTVRTMTDGSTIINPAAQVPGVPVPPAFFLMGSGLLGMFGIRRKMNA